MVLNPFQDNLAWLWDIIAAFISLVTVFAVVQVNGLIQKSGKLPSSVTRKIVHILVGPVYILTWLLFSGKIFSRYIAMIVPILFVVQFTAIGTGRLKDEAFLRSMSRSGDPSELLKGTLYYAIIIVVVTILWFYMPPTGLNDANPAALVIIGCLAGGDGLADIIGRRFGGDNKFGIRGAQKTIAGTTGMLLGSFLFSYMLVGIFSIGIPTFNLFHLGVPILIISIVATIAEALSPPNIDNFIISIAVIITVIILSIVAPFWWPFPIVSL
jgi:dolichol kinase